MLSQLSEGCRKDSESRESLVLVIGIGPTDDSLPELRREGIMLIKADVSHGLDVDIICDAHQLPFKDGSMDAVVIMNVLEHVLNPDQCVAEIHRVLRPDGVVYAQTPSCNKCMAGLTTSLALHPSDTDGYSEDSKNWTQVFSQAPAWPWPGRPSIGSVTDRCSPVATRMVDRRQFPNVLASVS
jgi:SAM-dependent methyltransferase